jgi:hypothetical protein
VLEYGATGQLAIGWAADVLSLEDADLRREASPFGPERRGWTRPSWMRRTTAA